LPNRFEGWLARPPQGDELVFKATHGTNGQETVVSFASRIAPHVDVELAKAAEQRALDQPAREFKFLERAHVLGQGSTVQHVRTHCLMLAWGSAIGIDASSPGNSCASPAPPPRPHSAWYLLETRAVRM
jgi:hypothetical protein